MLYDIILCGDSMRTENITAGFADMEKFKKLNTEAFPKQERVPVKNFLKMAEEGLIELIAVYDGEIFVGFCSVMADAPTAYLCYFAVENSLRRRGYGGRILNLLREKYAGCQVVLDLELVDSSAPNNEQRITRRNFYLRNGFYPTGYGMAYFGMEFELLCGSPNFDMEDFMRVIDKLKAKNFRPRVFEVDI